MVKRTATKTPYTPPQTRALTSADVARHHAGLAAHGAAATVLVRRMITGKRTLLRDDLAPEAREEGDEAWREFVLALWRELRDAYYHFWFLKHGGSDDAAEAWWVEAMPCPSLLSRLAIHDLFDCWPDRLEPPHCITAAEGALVTKWAWSPRPLAPQRLELLSKLDRSVPW